MPHCNEGHQLLIKCYITFIRFIRMVERASGSIYKPLMIITVSFLLKITLKFHVKCQSLGTPFEKGNGMVWYRHRHPLLLKCLPHPSWDIYEWFEELLISSTKPAMVNTVSLLPKTTLKFYVKKYQLLGILSAQEMRWCASRRDMHCCLGVSYPSLDKQGWLEELLAAPTRPVMFHTASLQQEITLKFHVKCQILGTLSA